MLTRKQKSFLMKALNNVRSNYQLKKYIAKELNDLI